MARRGCGCWRAMSTADAKQVQVSPGKVNELAHQIAANLISTLSRYSDPPPTEFVSHMNYVADHYLRNGWHDAGMAGQEIFTGLADEELLLTPMSAIEDRTDAYGIDFPASAFMEATCTLKSVVVIDMAIRKMKPEARESISESVTIVRATFDERNRVVIHSEELKTGLEKPVDLDACERLIQDYLLRPSADFSSIFE